MRDTKKIDEVVSFLLKDGLRWRSRRGSGGIMVAAKRVSYR